ncbi:hypothetical protein ACHAW6_004476 [Cyclotella cf. meneghiniana]
MKSIPTNFVVEKNKMSMSTYMTSMTQFSPTKLDNSPHIPSPVISIAPKKHALNKEISTAMKDLIQDKCKMTNELVPPGCHWHDAAKVTIWNFKAHFLSILAGIADDFPMTLWDKLLPQAKITINLLYWGS